MSSLVRVVPKIHGRGIAHAKQAADNLRRRCPLADDKNCHIGVWRAPWLAKIVTFMLAQQLLYGNKIPTTRRD
jgi:hypothetical protein